ncbi:YggS family pyridoxal phosphate-dependent enzyme [Dissulfurirhabdus thermomarina]|uniref:Pyridoxal phosphate homeostasis protein n=1 Tax=Dissulfurirhabdus thermomarina TaxID=1765737 RepID=A0A6N9TWA9_DISTH|nr:YggS family pyridoxal phosphate-dependent enzyme [Dissulfurirhabdus thermomarina]NDY42766.1 YggS family pyridoxal phosphate-dependent enzyme [Dissulfurirhabdus thermomarina]NMX24107.1 YggS family pyridoxal phosphate-dependent enzyme [Dissulfurirhabdus thermomarina]
MIARALDEIRRRIARAEARAGRAPGGTRLLAVTKTVPADRVRAAAAAGQRLFGENYLQEARAKLADLQDLRPETTWHFIGRLQRNKARAAVELFDCIESLDGLKLARTLDRLAGEAGRRLAVLVQVDLAGEPTKGGVAADELPTFLEAVFRLPNLSVEGLMCLPPWREDPEEVRPYFRRLRRLRDEAVRAGAPPGFRELSMGMSHDFEVAVEEGATLVRVGTALFGPRPKRPEA